MNRPLPLITLAAAVLLPQLGCVTSRAYDAKSAELDKVKHESAARDSEIKALKAQVSDLKRAVVQRDDRISILTVECDGQKAHR